jgi:hypothetical protein
MIKKFIAITFSLYGLSMIMVAYSCGFHLWFSTPSLYKFLVPIFTTLLYVVEVIGFIFAFKGKYE